MEFPLVTVILPIRNEAATIAHCLTAILDQTYPTLEIIVADGQSTDNTLAVIRALPDVARIQVIANPRKIPASGLNEAFKLATGHYIVRVDGHTILAPDYVMRCVELLQKTGAWNVGGKLNPVGITPMGRAIAAAARTTFAVPGVYHVGNRPRYTDTVYLGAWPREVWERVGGFDERFVINQDYEFNYRIRKVGGRIYFDPSIRSEYIGRQTLRALAIQYYRYGHGRVRTIRTHPRSLRPRQVAAPLWVVWCILTPLFVLNPLLLMLWVCGVLSYVALCVGFSMRAASRAGWGLLPRLPLVFVTLHWAWGIGFWVGMFRSFFDQKRF